MYKRRIIAFMIIIAICLLTLVCRLGWLQLIEADEYLADGDKDLRSPPVWLPAMRGQIKDRHGRILAYDEPCFDLSLQYQFLAADPKWISRDERLKIKGRYPLDARWIAAQQQKIGRSENVSPERAEFIFRQRWDNTWALVSRVAGDNGIADVNATTARVVRRIQRWASARGGDVKDMFRPHPIVKGLTDDQAVEIKAELEDTIGMSVQPSHRRRYSYGEHASHIIGFTQQIDRGDLERFNSPAPAGNRLEWKLSLYGNDDTIGKSGIERAHEQALRGRKGYLVRRAGKISESGVSQPGQNVQLTLDIELQKTLRDIWPPGQRGSIVVMSIPDGEILAMLSMPQYDLNRYHETEYFRAITTDEANTPLFHRAIAGTYPPGSVMKVLTTLAGLTEGTLGENSTDYCEGQLFYDNQGKRKFKCSHRHGEIVLADAIKKSCNVFFYHAGEKLGVPKLSSWYELFGFGKSTGLGLSEEKPGFIVQRGTKGIARMMAMGKSKVDVTPLQVANFMVTVARGGHFASPAITISPPPQRDEYDLPLSDSHVTLVKDAMFRAVNEPGGTAYKYARDEEIDICGKTGTAEIDKITKLNMAWFAGFAPYENPQVAFAVVVEKVSTSGGRTCGPIARAAVRACKEMGYIRSEN